MRFILGMLIVIGFGFYMLANVYDPVIQMHFLISFVVLGFLFVGLCIREDKR